MNASRNTAKSAPERLTKIYQKSIDHLSKPIEIDGNVEILWKKRPNPVERHQKSSDFGAREAPSTWLQLARIWRRSAVPWGEKKFAAHSSGRRQIRHGKDAVSRGFLGDDSDDMMF